MSEIKPPRINNVADDDDPVVINARRIRREKRLPTAEISRLIVDNIKYGESVAFSLLRRWGVRLTAEQVMSIVGESLAESANRFDEAKGASFNTFFFYHLRGNLLKEVEQYISNRKNLVSITDMATESMPGDVMLTHHSKDAHAEVRHDPEQILEDKQLSQICWDACSGLDDLEQEVVNRHFVEEEPLTAIAENLGYSRCHISRVKSKALARLGNVLQGAFNVKNGGDEGGAAAGGRYKGGRGRRK
ncbi:MAG: sigma-70 family RNA polymerase sigma factor [bacterium]|nr:sigma-70 family RNA polymerase sigma factor [bacterium]